jgi:hypothetical protein
VAASVGVPASTAAAAGGGGTVIGPAVPSDKPPAAAGRGVYGAFGGPGTDPAADVYTPGSEFNPDVLPKGVHRDMALQRVRGGSSSSAVAAAAGVAAAVAAALT